MNLYSKARKHIDMKRVKEIREEKIKREKIIELMKYRQKIIDELQEIEREESKHVDWRSDLNEMMTTVDMGMVNLPGMGDVNLADFDFPVTALGSSPGYSQDGNNYTFGPASAGVAPAETASLNIKMNSEKYDTIVFDWEGGTIDELFAMTGSDGGLNTYTITTSNGRKEIRLKPSDRKKSVSIAFNIGRDAGGGLGTNKMLNVSFRRVTPMNLVVGLDDPEANSFIRGGLGGSEERKAKLKDMLEAGNELMIKLGLEPSKTTPGDIELDPVDTGKDYGEIAAIYQSPDGTYQSFPGSVNPNKDASKWPSINDKPKPVKWPTPGIFPGQLPRV